MRVFKNKTEIAGRILISVCSVIIAILIFETSARFFYPVKFASFINHSTREWDQRGLPVVDSVFRISRTLGYELVPNCKIGTNSLGMLDKERHAEKTGDTYRIICLGDSTTANSGYTGLLEQTLNKEKKGRDFEVWNCAIPGYGALQYCRALKEKWLRYDPDMVIIGFCLNDFDTTPLFIREKNELVGYFPKNELLPRVNPFLLEHSYLYRFIVIKLFYSNIKYPLANLVEEVSVEMKNTADALSKKNIDLLIVIFGLSEPIQRYPYWNLTYETIKAIVDKNDFKYIDTIPVFEEYNSLDELQKSPGDEIHFGEKGSSIIADKLYDYISRTLGFKTDER